MVQQNGWLRNSIHAQHQNQLTGTEEKAEGRRGE